MKLVCYISIVFCVFLQTTLVQGQVDSLDKNRDTVVYLIAEEQPKPEIGIQKLHQKIIKKLQFQNIENADGCVKVVISFIVNKSGSLSNLEVLKNDCSDKSIPNQIFQIVKEEKWIVGKLNRKTVSVKFTLPI